ncbi:9122_t:CDS:2 [Ambispora gerdemannii]|uniref:9122_t:CDS:1 n=1 Tax=Ambispora gerdemannii TaxID=144530 RepID=A0A9N9EZC2_9GLOM|nr:9122_t:CDS:2 [Ambispora gerdemannii]
MDIRVVVGIASDVITNDDWPGRKGPLKITILQYDEDFTWNSQALVGKPQRRRKKTATNSPKLIELSSCT